MRSPKLISDAYRNKRILLTEVQTYLETVYGASDIHCTISETIESKGLLQTDYRKRQNCSLTSITELILYLQSNTNESGTNPVQPANDQEIFRTVLSCTNRLTYNEKGRGTNPFFIRPILKATLRRFGLAAKYSTHSRYLRSIPLLGYRYKTIVRLLQAHRLPLLLNLFIDKRHYYHDHTVTCIGFCEYTFTAADGKRYTKRFLQIHDNWCTSVSLIDYDRIGVISSIVYII